MHRLNRGFEDGCKKAIASKKHKNTDLERSRIAKEQNSEAIIKINKELYASLQQALNRNDVVDLRDIGKRYRRDITKAIGVGEASYTINRHYANQEEQKASRKKAFPSFYKICYGNKYFTDSYITLGSIYGVNVLYSSKDSLDALLEREFGSADDDELSVINYVDVDDVIKTKGNAINGPRKEDVGIFNRKMFEPYSKEVDRIKKNILIVNVNFFQSYKAHFADDRIIASDYVHLCEFDGQSRKLFSSCILVVHEKNQKAVFSILNEGRFILQNIDKKDVKSALSKCKMKINILLFDVFKLYSAEYSCRNAAQFTFNSFFKNCFD